MHRTSKHWVFFALLFVSSVALAEVAPSTSNGCGPADPDCRRRILWILNGIHLGAFNVEGGYRFGENATEVAVGFHAAGVSTDSQIGDLEALVFEAVYVPEAGGLRLRFTLAEGDVMFFCKDEEGVTHPPLLAFLYNCEPTAAIGLGATLLDVQHDSSTGRWATRWAQMNFVYNFLRNGNGVDYLRRRLYAFGGASLDTITYHNTPGAPIGDGRDTLVRMNFGVSGMIRSANSQWEVRGLAGYRPNVTDFSDFGFEAKFELLRHILVGNGQSLATVGLEAGYNEWSQPWRSIGTYASDRDRRNSYLRLMFRYMFQ